MAVTQREAPSRLAAIRKGSRWHFRPHPPIIRRSVLRNGTACGRNFGSVCDESRDRKTECWDRCQPSVSCFCKEIPRLEPQDSTGLSTLGQESRWKSEMGMGRYSYRMQGRSHRMRVEQGACAHSTTHSGHHRTSTPYWRRTRTIREEARTQMWDMRSIGRGRRRHPYKGMVLL